MPTLEAFLKDVAAGEPREHAGLTLVPLDGAVPRSLEYVLGAEAIEARTLTITEVSEGGSVPHLRAVNDAETMVLLLDGEELIGAKQNRILNTTVLLAPKSKTTIPVSCVEQGRWRYASPDFASGGQSSPRIRACTSPHVSQSLRTRGQAESDQGRVWDDVADHLAEMAVPSPTMAMHAAREHHRDRLADYLAALPYPEHARGILAAVGGRFAAVDVFDKAETLRGLWPRLVTGYALDALALRGRAKDEAPASSSPGEAGFAEQGKGEAGAVLKRAAGLACDPCPSVGVGEDWRFGGDGIVGQALVAEGVCVHLSVFPGEGLGESGDPADPVRSIARPSVRRRRRHE
jgi:hypothetical protein